MRCFFWSFSVASCFHALSASLCSFTARFADLSIGKPLVP